MEKTLEIIDGQQRLLTICEFIDNVFPISGQYLMVLNEEEYNGLYYRDLPQDHRNRINRDTMAINLINDEMPAWKIYVLINGGVNPLSKQELRKAFFSEEEQYWIIDALVKSDFWQSKLNDPNKKFEKDSELLHKALISYLYGEDPQFRNLSATSYVEVGLRKIIEDYTPEQLQPVVNRFRVQCLEVIEMLFNEVPNQPFRRIRVLDGGRSNISTTYIPIMAYAFGKLRGQYQLNRITDLRDELVSEFDYFMSVDDDNPGLEKTTAGNTPARFLATAEQLYQILANLMGEAPGLLRSTEHRISTQMAEAVRRTAQKDEHDRFVCGICNLPIAPTVSYDIDHIEPVIEGGRTELGNLRITHATCNRGR